MIRQWSGEESIEFWPKWSEMLKRKDSYERVELFNDYRRRFALEERLPYLFSIRWWEGSLEELDFDKLLYIDYMSRAVFTVHGVLYINHEVMKNYLNKIAANSEAVYFIILLLLYADNLTKTNGMTVFAMADSVHTLMDFEKSTGISLNGRDIVRMNDIGRSFLR